MRKYRKIWWNQRGHKLRHSMAHTHCMLDKQGDTRARACTGPDTHTHARAHRQICNIYCFSTAKLISPKRLSTTLQEHCLSCLQSFTVTLKKNTSGRFLRYMMLHCKSECTVFLYEQLTATYKTTKIFHTAMLRRETGSRFLKADCILSRPLYHHSVFQLSNWVGPILGSNCCAWFPFLGGGGCWGVGAVELQNVSVVSPGKSVHISHGSNRRTSC
jgi:hypothetical protein